MLESIQKKNNVIYRYHHLLFNSEEEEASSEEWTDVESDDDAQRSPKPLRDSTPRTNRSQSDLMMLYFSDDSFGYDDYSDDGISRFFI